MIGIAQSYFTKIACIKLPVVCVSCCTVSKYKCLHPPLCRLFGHVLQEPKPTFEADYSLIHRELPPKCECCFEVGNERVHKWSQLVEGIIARFPLWNVLCAIVEMQKGRRSENRSRLMIELKVEMANGQDVTQ